MSPSLLWFRRDLRLRDNPALRAALARGGPVLPVFILDDAGEGRWAPGAAARWWLHHSLVSLDGSLRARGSRLILARGDSAAALRDLARRTGAGAVFWNDRCEPAVRERDCAVEADLKASGLETARGNSTLLFEPSQVGNRQGGPFQVFTPFWRHCLALTVPPPLGLPRGHFRAPGTWPGSLGLGDLELLPGGGLDGGLSDAWQPGEAGAMHRLRRFVSRSIDAYADGRDFPDRDGTSRLSPWLHFGELGPRQVWAAVEAGAGDSGVFPPSRGAGVFLAELGWREFAAHLLIHFPRTPEEPLREAFRRFPWADDRDGAKLAAWQRGKTGYPIVDAGMRQLLRTGWMHNRVRMIAASFLVKDLRLPWTQGAAWFWDRLVDADLASNTLGWQWCAGCGADAAPYFRVFSPVRQGMRFDCEGNYVRRWVPELSRLPGELVHRPWEAPADALAATGVRLGETYPYPMVDHAEARKAALAALKRLRSDRPPASPAGPVRGPTSGERADNRLRALTIRLNRGRSPRASDIRPIA